LLDREELFPNSSLGRALACYTTMWSGEPGHDVPNPYTFRHRHQLGSKLLIARQAEKRGACQAERPKAAGIVRVHPLVEEAALDLSLAATSLLPVERMHTGHLMEENI
jgi:hypothetical protein